MAASKRIERFGKVISLIEAKEAVRFGLTTEALRESRYSPNQERNPEASMISMPGIVPQEAIECGMAYRAELTGVSVSGLHAPACLYRESYLTLFRSHEKAETEYRKDKGGYQSQKIEVFQA